MMATTSGVVAAGSGRRFSSPLARALARREGLSLSGLLGSGPLGRIVKADVLGALAGGSVSPSTQGSAFAGPAFDEIPNSIGRRLIARRMTESKQQAPHFYLRIDCNMDPVMQLRSQRRQADGLRLSVNDFVIKAAAMALRDVPAVNASYSDAAIRRYRQVHIGLAVAVQDGLVTPVITDADQQSLAQIAATVAQLVSRARAGRLEAGAARGATFSISNLGAYGVREFAAVINPPQGAILAVGAGEPRAVVKDGQLGIATMMTVTLSADHRVIDGAAAAQWLASFRQHLENPQSMGG